MGGLASMVSLVKWSSMETTSQLTWPCGRSERVQNYLLVSSTRTCPLTLPSTKVRPMSRGTLRSQTHHHLQAISRTGHSRLSFQSCASVAQPLRAALGPHKLGT